MSTETVSFSEPPRPSATHTREPRQTRQNDPETVTKTALPPHPQASRKAAIEAMCRECIVDETQPGGWRQQVGACACRSCPLFSFRPMPRSANRKTH